MTGKDPVAIADFDDGFVCASPTTGVKERERIRLSRTPEGGPGDPTAGPKGALEPVGQLSAFVYQRPSGRME
jgi:hypothetical protein